MDFEALAKARADFDALVADVRPQLLRYCARMTGSAVDGEDIVQEALAKVYFRLPQLGHVENLRAWLFRVAHNKALDYLRRYDVRFGETLEGELPAHTEDSPLDAAEVAEWGLSHFVRLTALQRSCVILKDVLSYRLEEISEILDVSVPSIKGALHRGRASLRRQTAEDAPPAPALPPEQAALLGRYVALFNARDFDALRAMLAEDVQLELVGMTEKSGAADVGGYFNNYARLEGMRLELGRWTAARRSLRANSPTAGRSTSYSYASATNGFGSSATTATRGMSSMKRSGPARQKSREVGRESDPGRWRRVARGISGERNERLARLRLDVRRIDNRQLCAGQPPGGHEVQRRKRVVGRRLIVLGVRDERAESIRRHHFGWFEVFAGKCRLAAPGRSDQDDQGQLRDREGHRTNTAICVGGPTWLSSSPTGR